MLSPEMIDVLFCRIKASRGVLDSEQVRILCAELNVDFNTLTLALLPVAAKFARPPISQFYVGAIAVEKDAAGFGTLYFGANLEFSYQALSLVVHAEQAAINNAWLNGAKQIDTIVITDAPCGYCRQFMNELHGAEALKVVLPHINTSLSALLPNAFGPLDLDNSESLFNSKPVALTQSDTVSKKLFEVARRSYAPYSNNYSAVEITTDAGCFYGAYIENAAYSPSLSPLQGALSQLALAGFCLDQVNVQKITLLETQGKANQLGVVNAVLASFDKPIELVHVLVDRN